MTMNQKMKDAIELIARVALEAAEPAMARSMATSGEKSLQFFVRSMVGCGGIGALMDPIKIQEQDQFCFELPLRGWRADLVVFHVDGSATVVEMKDGRHGISTVLAGIGQCGMYASLLGMAGGVSKVRRALMWTKISGDAMLDQLVGQACSDAGVTPLFMPTMSDLHRECMAAATKSIVDMVREAPHGSA